MATTIILIRHAAHGHLGRILSGRTPGVPLTEAGRAQAARLAERVAPLRPDLVQASPIRRAQETARAIAGDRVETADALTEIDFGDWTGRGFDALAGDPAWDAWNAARGAARPPGGESMAAVQARVVAHCEAAARAHDGRTVAMVSHADVVRAVVAHVLALPLDNLLRFDIDPASATTILWGDGWARLVRLNEGE